jgi:very-short-patch-repair endonuclease
MEVKMKRDTPKYIVDISKELRRNQTTAEKVLWSKLRGNNIKGYKFRRQYAVGRYIADFYCCEKRLAIEIDGEIHNLIDRREYDEIRQEEIEARLITVLRFSNEEIYNQLEYVLKKITESLAPLPRSGEGLG